MEIRTSSAENIQRKTGTPPHETWKRKERQGTREKTNPGRVGEGAQQGTFRLPLRNLGAECSIGVVRNEFAL